MNGESRRVSLHAIANAIEQETFDVSEDGASAVSNKTVERRFQELVKRFGLDIRQLKNAKGEIYFGETEAVWVTALLRQSIDKNGFLYKLIKDTDENITFEEIRSFMDGIDGWMEGKVTDEERGEFMRYLDQSLKYSAMLEVERIFRLVDALNRNLGADLYERHLSALSGLRRKLEVEFAVSSVEAVLRTTQLAEALSLYREMTGEGPDYAEAEDSSLQAEYVQRDAAVKAFLEEHPLIRRHIEEQLGKGVEELFG